MGHGASRPVEPRLETVIDRRLRRLNAFPQPYRKYIAGLSSCAPAIEDLADSFPALLFSLATGYGTVRRRQAAFDAVVAGQSLKVAAAQLELPLWLRKLPPSAFVQPIPVLPGDEEFATAALSRMPDTSKEAAIWFDRLVTGYQLVGREFSLWTVREPRLLPPHTTDEDMQWLLAWAWASLTPTFSGHHLIRTEWTPQIGWKRARDEVAIWRKRIDLVGALAGPPRDPWLGNACILGLDIVALRTVDDFIAESLAMENCLDQYAAHLAYGRVRVFSVRKDGRPIADVEVTIKAEDASTPCISQIRGPRNRRAPPAVWQAIHAWLASQPARPLDASPTPAQATRDAFREFWRPYVSASEGAGLPMHILSRILGRDARRGRPAEEAGLLPAAIAPRQPARPAPNEAAPMPSPITGDWRTNNIGDHRLPATLALGLRPGRR